jgi:hypothetical protein
MLSTWFMITIIMFTDGEYIASPRLDRTFETQAACEAKAKHINKHINMDTLDRHIAKFKLICVQKF